MRDRRTGLRSVCNMLLEDGDEEDADGRSGLWVGDGAGDGGR